MKLNGQIRSEIAASVKRSVLAEAQKNSAAKNPEEKGISTQEYFSRTSQIAEERKVAAEVASDIAKKVKMCLSLFATSEELEEAWPEAAAHIPEWLTAPRGMIYVPKPLD